MAAAFQVQTSTIASGTGEIKVVEAEGELDLDTHLALQGELDALVDGAGRRLLVDLSRLAFIDSVGIATIYHASTRFARLALVVLPGSRVAGMLERCAIDQMLPVASTRAEAVQALA